MRAHLTIAFMVLGIAFSPPALCAEPDGLVVGTATGAKVTLTAAELAELPVTRVTFATDHGQRQAAFEGPLLWTVLEHAAALDPKPRVLVRQTVLITGSDGYTAVLALGELSPEFEGKQVILAEREDDKPLGPAHLRVIVPGDTRGGRSVHDVVSLTVSAPGS